MECNKLDILIVKTFPNPILSLFVSNTMLPLQMPKTLIPHGGQ